MRSRSLLTQVLTVNVPLIIATGLVATIAVDADAANLVKDHRLRPAVLDDHGLVPALHSQVRDFAEQTGLDASSRTRGSMPQLSPEQRLVIYRVTQESLSNVAQHADARKVDVELPFIGRMVLRISDNGHGFAFSVKRYSEPPRRNDALLMLNERFDAAGITRTPTRLKSVSVRRTVTTLLLAPPGRRPTHLTVWLPAAPAGTAR